MSRTEDAVSRPAGRLDRSVVRRTMRLSVVDAATYAFMVGLGEVFFLADAIRLGASPLEQSLIVTLPLCLGGAGPLAALRFLRRAHARKPFVVTAALGQALALVALAVGDATRVSTPVSLIACVCVYQMCGQAAGTAWSSWFGDLVPKRIRGRYFSRRNRAAYAATCAGLLVGGLVLHVFEPGKAGDELSRSGRGFCVLFASAALLRVVSSGLLASSAEPSFRGLSDRVRVLRYFASNRGTGAWRLLLLVASLQFVVYIAGPYFQPFMLETLGFTYMEYTAASMTVIVMKIAFVPAWGALIDQTGARQLCSLSAILLALIPVPYLWAEGIGWVLVAQAFSGFAWAGFEVSEFTLLLESSYRSTRLQVFAALSVGNGLAQLLGGLVGAFLVDRVGTIRVVFAVSIAARVAVAATFPRLLPTPVGAPQVRRRDLLLRVIGFRPSGGLVHRPVAPLVAPPGERSRRTRRRGRGKTGASA